ncbi:MAG TPA: nitroreductase family protein [Candidatus Nitrosotalea sp.]|nr:nitroreductase family protein [Candidatus Nitrosotalea sp.]
MKTALNPWQIPTQEFPENGLPSEKWKFFLRYAMLAPSSHNSQPWLFHLHDQKLELRADRRRACHIVDPEDRELTISCGCALFILRCAMRHFGCLGEVAILPDPKDKDLMARVSLGEQEETSVEDSLLFYAIPRRRTNRQTFSTDPVPASLVTALKDAAEAESTWFHVIDNEESRYAVADLISEGDRRQWANKDFRLELGKWVHANRSSARDGIPGYAQGIDDLLSCAGPLVVRTFNMGEGQAAKDHEVATGSPILAVLGTDGDSPWDWVAAGQALARVLLRARVEDVWASFLNQPIELADLRSQLQKLSDHKGFPQACLRFGFGEEVRPTPRREVEEVLI